MKLFTLPYAGGSSHCYSRLAPYLDNFILPVALELPGRGKRICEPLLTEMPQLVDDLFQRIAPELNSPYAFYGHSMGALLSWLLSLKAFEHNLPAPQHLFLSGHAGPQSRTLNKRYHHLPKQQFLDGVIGLGGTIPAVAASPELLDFFEPILRADFTAIENYDPADMPVLPLPMTIMMGSEEEYNREQLLSWQQVTRHPLQLNEYQGDHFFIFNHWDSIGSLISRTLEKAEQNTPLLFSGRP